MQTRKSFITGDVDGSVVPAPVPAFALIDGATEGLDPKMAAKGSGGTGRGRRTKYPWARMELNQFFFVPGVTSSAMSSVATRAARRTGHKYQCTRERRDGVWGVHVWRYE